MESLAVFQAKIFLFNRLPVLAIDAAAKDVEPFTLGLYYRGMGEPRFELTRGFHLAPQLCGLGQLF